jgi:hypothetical protein
MLNPSADTTDGISARPTTTNEAATNLFIYSFLPMSRAVRRARAT